MPVVRSPSAATAAAQQEHADSAAQINLFICLSPGVMVVVLLYLVGCQSNRPFNIVAPNGVIKFLLKNFFSFFLNFYRNKTVLWF